MSEGRIIRMLALLWIVASLDLPATAIAQEPISEIPFESIPAKTTLLAESITLDGDTVCTGSIVGSGLIESQQGGFKFPDGTVQTTAAPGDDSAGNPTGTLLAFAGVTAPSGYLIADGSLLDAAQNGPLCAVLAGRFNQVGDPAGACRLPDLRGRVPVGAGTGTGLSPRAVGDQLGNESQTLAAENVPAHEHPLNALVYRFAGSAAAFGLNANNAVVAGCPYGPGDSGPCEGPGRDGTKVRAAANTGGSQPFEITQPSLVISYIIKD